jgi:hypothetical protein
MFSSYANPCRTLPLKSMKKNLKFINSVKRNKKTFFIACIIFTLELGFLSYLLISPDNKQIAIVAKILPVFILGFGISTFKDFFIPNDFKREQLAAENVITFIENKGIFYLAYCKENPKACYESAKEIRNKLTDTLSGIRETIAYNNIHNIRETCFELMQSLEENRIRDVEYEMNLNSEQREVFYKMLTDFRNNSRVAIHSICTEYGITIRGSLSNLEWN